MVNITSNREYFFQSDKSIQQEQELKLKRTNKNGDPISLSTKIISSHLVVEQDSLFCGLSNGTIQLLELRGWRKGKNLSVSNSPISSLTYCSKESLLICGSWDKKIRIWKQCADEFVLLNILDEHADYVQSLLYCERSCRLFSGCFSGKFYVWDVDKNPSLISTVQLHRRSIEQIIEIPNTTYIATASSDTTIKIFDYNQLIVKSELVGGHQTNVSCISCTDNLGIFSGSADKSVIQWDIEEIENNSPSSPIPNDLKISRSGQVEIGEWVTAITTTVHGIVYAGCENGKIFSIDGNEMRILGCFDGHFDRVTGLSIYSSFLVSCSLDGTIRRWSMSEKSNNSELISKEEEAELEALLLSE